MSLTPELAASRLAEIKMTQDLLTKEADELKAFLLDALDPDQEIEAQNTGFVRVIYRKGSTTKREYAPAMLSLLPENAYPYLLKASNTAIERLVKDRIITKDVKALIDEKYCVISNEPTLRVKYETVEDIQDE